MIYKQQMGRALRVTKTGLQVGPFNSSTRAAAIYTRSRLVTFIVEGQNKYEELNEYEYRRLLETNFWKSRKFNFSLSEKEFAMLLLMIK